MKTKGTFPGSFSVVDYKITSEYKMKLPQQPICTPSKWRSYFIWQPYPMVGKPSQNPENFIQQADTLGNWTITLTSKKDLGESVVKLDVFSWLHVILQLQFSLSILSAVHNESWTEALTYVKSVCQNSSRKWLVLKTRAISQGKYSIDSKPTTLGHPLKKISESTSIWDESNRKKVTYCHGMSFSKGLGCLIARSR